MKRRDAIAYLTREGNLRVPCSRYGRDTFDCAPVAWRLSSIMAEITGEEVDEDKLEADMSLVVNDGDDVAYILHEYGTARDRALLRQLGISAEECRTD